MTTTVTDLFCGAGGSSSGLEALPGVEIKMAANHWALAIETHNTNLPHVSHDCADISQVDPRRYPRTDILWASPECTNHSIARGIKREDAQPNLFDEVLPVEAAVRSRATMWDVVRFAEYHRYRAVIVENVVDAYYWQPFKAWLMAMDLLGYSHRIVWLNSMHAQGAGAPAPQSRDRMYVVFWRTGERVPDIEKWTRPMAWCPNCEKVVQALQVFKKHDVPAWGRYKVQYVYKCPTQRCHVVVEPGVLPAATAIDWALPGERIGDRTKPLAPKTIARIETGLKRFGRPIHVEAGGNAYDSMDPKHRQHGSATGYLRAWPLDTEPLKTLTTSETKAIAYVPPLLVPVEGREGKAATSVDEVMRTMTTRRETALVCPPTIQPFIVPLRANNTAKSTAEPFDTFAASGYHHALLSYYGKGGVRRVEDPMATVTTKDRLALLELALAVEDCHFRMLTPDEIKIGMAFARDYVMLGNKREQVRLAGNAVTPPAARDLGAAVVEALTGVALDMAG